MSISHAGSLSPSNNWFCVWVNEKQFELCLAKNKIALAFGVTHIKLLPVVAVIALTFSCSFFESVLFITLLSYFYLLLECVVLIATFWCIDIMFFRPHFDKKYIII